MSRLTRRALLTLLGAGLCALGMPAALAAPDPSSGTGLLRVMHLSPDTPAFDAYIDPVPAGEHAVLPRLGYGDVSPYQRLRAGTYTVSARAVGADPASPPVLTSTVTVAPGGATTVAGSGHFADLGFMVLSDDLTLPPSGRSRARVINAAPTGSPLNLSLDGSTLAGDLPFGGSTDPVDVPGPGGTLTMTDHSGTPTELPVQLAAGSVYTVLVLDRSDGGLTVSTTLDAASSVVVPVGGVEAGAGGTADDGLPAGRFTLAVLALGALLVTLRTRLRHRRRPARHAAR
jgi:hypothetical protein